MPSRVEPDPGARPDPASAAALPPAAARVSVQRWRGGHWQQLDDRLAEEVPVALLYNGVPQMVMLASPRDLEDFALGFSLTEGFIDEVGELVSVEVLTRDAGIELRLTVPEWRAAALGGTERNLTGRTGCGLCGARTLAQAVRVPPRVSAGVSLESASLHRALDAIGAYQHINRDTGAVHAAGWATPEGELLLVREDVGRHNALDKLIGALATRRTDFTAGVLLVTSRASYEMVQKAAVMGITLMAAISAPTALAVRLARNTGFTLIGFARRGDHVVYACPERLRDIDRDGRNIHEEVSYED